MSQHHVIIEIEDVVWSLFEKYVLVVNARAKQLGLPRVSIAKIVGAIMTRYLLAHQQEIREIHAQIHLERAVGSTKVAFGSAGLSIAQATLATIPTKDEILGGAGSHGEPGRPLTP